MDRMPIVQERLLLARRRKDWTQAEVAARVGMFKTDISKYERGTSVPTLARLVKLADVFEVSADFLLGRCGDTITTKTPQPSAPPPVPCVPG